MKRRIFSPKERALIEELYPSTPTAQIAEMLNCNLMSIYHYANYRKISKTEEFLSSDASGRISKTNDIGKNTRFVKGKVSSNKGKKMPAEVYEKAKATMFKKGNKPHNTKFDGYLSVRKYNDGKSYIYIRVAEGKFELLHRFMWEQINGKIPEGYKVVFKDGNQANVCIENLELVSNSDLMLRNSIQNYPDDIKFTIRALTKLKKTINRYGQEHNG